MLTRFDDPLGDEATNYFERSAWLRAVAADNELAFSARFRVSSATALERVYLPSEQGGTNTLPGYIGSTARDGSTKWTRPLSPCSQECARMGCRYTN